MGACLFGLEAELAIAALRRDGTALPTGEAVHRLYTRAKQTLPHLCGGGSRLFLQNGGLIYIDAGNHPEYATPEITTPWEAVSYLRSGERLVAGLAASMCDDSDLASVLVHRCNVDFLSGTTWGCHESYLGRRPVKDYAAHLIPHLISRIIYSGSGGLDPSSAGILFSLSPRTSFITQTVSGSSTENRGIFNTRDEPLARGGSSRVHVICGDNACSELATWLKVGTTVLIVALVDAGVDFAGLFGLADPLKAMKRFAHAPGSLTPERPGRSASRTLSAVRIQQEYLRTVRDHARSAALPSWAEDVCDTWARILTLIERDDAQLTQSLDWALKGKLFTEHIARRGFDWGVLATWTDALAEVANAMPAQDERQTRIDDEALLYLRDCGHAESAAVARASATLSARGLDWSQLNEINALRDELCALDMHFGEVGSGIFAELDRRGPLRHRVCNDDDLVRSMDTPPIGTRAYARGRWVARLNDARADYLCGWDQIRGPNSSLDLSDPWCMDPKWRARRNQEKGAVA